MELQAKGDRRADVSCRCQWWDSKVIGWCPFDTQFKTDSAKGFYGAVLTGKVHLKLNSGKPEYKLFYDMTL